MPQILLAPMEGLADAALRQVLTTIGGYDWGIAEFVRVTESVLPARTFLRVCPELLQGGTTTSGTPMRVQLLGSDPDWLAKNAQQLLQLSPPGVDLNFGCPVPQVFKNGAGAALLEQPERLYAIVRAVRAVLPAALPLTAKMRLGIDDPAQSLDVARALAEGGADALIVHARTRADFYRPPARWEWIARIRSELSVPVIANGEIWTPEDARRCQAVTGCADLMLGRGAIADPLLARRIRGDFSGAWPLVAAGIDQYWAMVKERVQAGHAGGRLKLWLSWLRRAYPEAQTLYTAVRPLKTPREIDAALRCAGVLVAGGKAGA